MNEARRLYHNPGCSKSRAALELLSERCAGLDVVEYLHQQPSRSELEELVAALDAPVDQLVRRDARFHELAIDEVRLASAEQIVELLLEHPELLQRPILVIGGRARIGRPPEALLGLLD